MLWACQIDSFPCMSSKGVSGNWKLETQTRRGLWDLIYLPLIASDCCPNVRYVMNDNASVRQAFHSVSVDLFCIKLNLCELILSIDMPLPRPWGGARIRTPWGLFRFLWEEWSRSHRGSRNMNAVVRFAVIVRAHRWTNLHYFYEFSRIVASGGPFWTCKNGAGH